MAKIRDIATRALRKIGVVAEDEAANADQIANAVDAYNMMVHAWKLRDVDLSHVDQGASDTFALGNEYQEGAVYLLASNLSGDYVIPPSFDADRWFRSIQNANITIEDAALDRALYLTPVRRAKYGYTVDSEQ